MRFKEKDEIVNNIEFKFHNKKVIQNKQRKDDILIVLKNCTLELE